MTRLAPYRDEIAALREKGWSQERIARKFGGTAGGVGWLLLTMGAEGPSVPPPRPPLKAPRSYKRRGRTVRFYTVADDRRLLALEAEGKTVAAIARALKRSESSIRGRLATLARRDERAESFGDRASDSNRVADVSVEGSRA